MRNVEAIVVSCDLNYERGPRLSFRLTEFVSFDDGSVVCVRSDRGWTQQLFVDKDPWPMMTREVLEENVRATVRLDPEVEAAWFDWMVPVLEDIGITSSGEALRSVPLTISYDPIILARLAQVNGGTTNCG